MIESVDPNEKNGGKKRLLESHKFFLEERKITQSLSVSRVVVKLP